MKLKQVLMASSAMLMLATPYLPAQAQTAASNARISVAQAVPPALTGAIQAYREAQDMLEAAQASGDDVAAAEEAFAAAEAELAALCAAIGQPDIEACIALAEGGGFEEPAVEIVPEVEPEPEPEPEPVVEEPVIEQEPEPQPDPVVEEPVVEEPVAEEPVVEPEPTLAPEPEPEVMEESEPAPAEVEEPQVEVAPEPAVETPAAPSSSAPAPLVAAVDAYRQALADYEAALAAGGDTSAAASALAAAEADLRDICSIVGLADLDACLAAFEIDLDIVAPEAATDAPVVTLPAPQEVELEDDIVLEGDIQGELVPEGTSVEEVAPLLDSDKDAFAAEARGDAETEADAEVQVAAPPAEPVAAPTSDVEAQPEVDTQQIVAITAEEGTRRETAPLTAEQQGAQLVGPVERPTNIEIITTIGLATVFAIGANYFIDSLDTPRIVEDNYRDYWIEDLPGGRTREIIVRPDGTQLVTIRDRYGDIIRRSRIERDGREILLVYVDENYRRYDDQGRWIDPARELPPLRLNIPAREYVLDASYADEQRVASFLAQPPVETLQRYYTIEEVKRSSRLRDMVRRLEIGDLTFETASANIGPDQVANLSAVANAMLDLIRANPAETFLIEGHTDAVGADLYNLELSNRRAESIAYALTRVYGIPPENLATQGYGERYLKINTQAAERLNRRVTIRRITPLITPIGTAG